MNPTRCHSETTAHPPFRREASNVDPRFVVCAFPKAESLRLPSRDFIESDRHMPHLFFQTVTAFTWCACHAIQSVYTDILGNQEKVMRAKVRYFTFVNTLIHRWNFNYVVYVNAQYAGNYN